jgi:hypothetical protein
MHRRKNVMKEWRAYPNLRGSSALIKDQFWDKLLLLILLAGA